MKYHSTRNNTNSVSLHTAIEQGLAPDGGLYVPAYLPSIDFAYFSQIKSYAQFAVALLSPFFEDDARLAPHLSYFCHEALNFPVPLTSLNPHTWLLGLHHGPTLSFKDFGARFLAACLNTLSTDHKTTILVATSGDTGSAVAAALYKKTNINAVILYPEGKISARQAQQITCWGDNILALAVSGTFDDCQQLVKSAFQDPYWKNEFHLSTANSINIGRLLPQMVYYAYWSTQLRVKQQITPHFIVPSGNLGNVTAAFWAKSMGFPIGDIILACNANQVMVDYCKTGEYQPRPSINTLANAMDVGKPSNLERLQFLFPRFSDFKSQVKVVSVSNQDICTAIKTAYQQDKIIICPHTATAYYTRLQLADDPYIVVATADPAKFETVIEPLLNIPVPITPALQHLLNRHTQTHTLLPDLETLLSHIKNHFLSQS